MLNSKVIKIIGYGLSGAGMIIGFASDFIGRKLIVQELAESKEVRDLIAKEVAKSLIFKK